ELALTCAKNLIKDSNREGKSSRNSMEPIAHILSRENPLAAVSDATKRMDAASPSTGGEAEAIWARDRLIVKLLMSNPLRAKNIKFLTIAPLASGEPAQLHKVN